MIPIMVGDTVCTVRTIKDVHNHILASAGHTGKIIRSFTKFNKSTGASEKYFVVESEAGTFEAKRDDLNVIEKRKFPG